MKKLLLATTVSLVAALTGQAQITASNWTGGVGGVWSSPDNWGNGIVPNSNSNRAQGFGTNDTEANVDGSYTVSAINGGARGATWTIGGTGTVTIDSANESTSNGLYTSTPVTESAGTLRLNGNVNINRTGGGQTLVQNLINSGNQILFDSGNVLTLTTNLETRNGVGGSIAFNGILAGAGGGSLRINSSNVSIGTGHDSSSFLGNIVFIGGKLSVDGGTVLSSTQRFQVNNDAELELNGLNAINGAGLTVGGASPRTLLLDVNVGQDDMGIININAGSVLQIDLGTSVSLLAFDSGGAWDGSIAITGFRENVIRFGTDATGLTVDQLGAIDGGAYSLSGSGFLTAVPEPSTYAILFGCLALGHTMIRRRRIA